MQAIVLDLDGVMYHADEPIPGAAEAVTRLQEQGVPLRFLTNTTSGSRRALMEKLGRQGVATDEASIITPAYVAREWLREREPKGVALFVTSSTVQEFFGLPLLPPDAEEGADFVVVGDMGEAWDFHTLNRAFRLLHSNPQATLLALGLSRIWQAADGLRLDVAPFVAALENAAERRAVVLGKPERPFFLRALADLAVVPVEALMVGDDVRFDIGAAQAVGMRALLVRTGKYRPGDLQRGVLPDAVLDSVADLPEWWARIHEGANSQDR